MNPLLPFLGLAGIYYLATSNSKASGDSVEVTPPELPKVPPINQELKVAGYNMVLNLRSSKKYKEDKTLVKRFQSLAGLKVDGLYGPATALALAAYDVVPPKPLYWAKATADTDKYNYSKLISDIGATKSNRAEWLEASNVQ